MAQYHLIESKASPTDLLYDTVVQLKAFDLWEWGGMQNALPAVELDGSEEDF